MTGRSSLGRQVLRRLEVTRLDKHEPRVAVRSRARDRTRRGKVGDHVAALGHERQVRLGPGLAGETVGEEVAVVALSVCYGSLLSVFARVRETQREGEGQLADRGRRGRKRRRE